MLGIANFVSAIAIMAVVIYFAVSAAAEVVNED